MTHWRQTGYRLRHLVPILLLLQLAMPARGGSLPEYGIKAGFLYSFTNYTTWPDTVGATLRLCVFGQDPFGEYLNDLAGKKVLERQIAVRRLHDLEDINSCHIVFISRTAENRMREVLNRIKGKPTLTVADTPNATHQGVALNMRTQGNKVVFEANLAAARAHGLHLSARLLRLAKDVIQ